MSIMDIETTVKFDKSLHKLNKRQLIFEIHKLQHSAKEAHATEMNARMYVRLMVDYDIYLNGDESMLKPFARHYPNLNGLLATMIMWEDMETLFYVYDLYKQHDAPFDMNAVYTKILYEFQDFANAELYEPQTWARDNYGGLHDLAQHILDGLTELINRGEQLNVSNNNQAQRLYRYIYSDL